jgi:hypothetical protein
MRKKGRREDGNIRYWVRTMVKGNLGNLLLLNSPAIFSYLVSPTELKGNALLNM